MNPRRLWCVAVVVAACHEPAPTSTSVNAYDPVSAQLRGLPHPFWARGYGPVSPQANPGDTVQWHNGNVIVASKTFAIFWGREWSDASFAGDQITGLASFLQGWNNSHYANILTEYFGANGQITAASTYLGSVIDSSRAPIDAPDLNPPATELQAVVAEVCKEVAVPDPAAVYMVYASSRFTAATGYCAFHAEGTCGRHPMQFAFYPSTNMVSSCGAGDMVTTHSPALASLANSTAHELAEAITDARVGTGWWDNGNGEEIADRCDFVISTPFVTLSNNSVWHVQGEWSNSAFDAGTGDTNTLGEHGCLYGR